MPAVSSSGYVETAGIARLYSRLQLREPGSAGIPARLERVSAKMDAPVGALAGRGCPRSQR